MARRRGFVSALNQYQRQVQQQEVARLRAQRQSEREAERAQRAFEQAKAADERERKRLYVEARAARVAADNDHLSEVHNALETLLASSLSKDPTIQFASLRREHSPVPFDPGELARPNPAPDPSAFRPPPPTGLRAHLSRTRREYEQAFEAGRVAYEAAVAQHQAAETGRLAAIAEAQRCHEEAMAKEQDEVRAQNEEIDALQADHKAGNVEAIISYFALVLDRSSYPEGFPRQYRLAYVPESKQLVIEYELPTFDVVPVLAGYKYAKTADKISETARPSAQRRALYTTVVGQSALRTAREIFSSDSAGYVESLVFNGHVRTTDPGTGQPIHPCLISVRTTAETFSALDLSKVDPIACLKALNAGVSKSPAELVPVRPVLDFSMVDSRFIEETDVLSSLDQRPNLMELTPSEFESLITNLFEKMGLETKLTQASRDGGVDCVAYDPRPILGGKVVIQAKRYKNTVGVSAVRDLFGTMHNEGASKGILVTTSGYGKAAFQFAEGKPLELLSGSNLLYLLAEHAGIEAKIEPPDDWVDPTFDTEVDDGPA